VATLVVAASLFGLSALHLLHTQTAAEEPRPALESAAPAPAPIDPTQTAPRVLATQPPVTDRVLQLETTRNDFGAERFVEALPSLRGQPTRLESLRVLYSLDTQLTRHAFEVLRDGKVALGHVILLDPDTGRVLTYASTDAAQFPPNRLYPAASLVKVITAAAALDVDPGLAGLPCRYSGSPYALSPRSIDPPRKGHEISLRKALASSNNQCFAQLAVHAVGQEPLIDAISRFGWLSEPAPAHPAGKVDPGEDRFDLGRLGCGLAGARITPLHAAQLAAVLARGEPDRAALDRARVRRRGARAAPARERCAAR
jgi:membrane peptidoglycan carboxypeptidase